MSFLSRPAALSIVGAAGLLLAAVPAGLAGQPEAAQPSEPSRPRLSAAARREIVEATASAYADHYVFEDKGRLIAAHLRRRLSRGAFDSAGDLQALADALTTAVREVAADRHIEVSAPRPVAPSGAEGGPPSRAQRYAWLDRLRRRNYDFVRVERLPGNVGLLRLDSFPPPEVAGATAAAAMAFLKHSDALIIDLRENRGGTGDMVRFLASYFFVEPTRLSRTFRRNRVPQASFDMTLADIPGERMPIVDLFILTSGRTFSAAEGFAFALQQQRRAEVVGEASGGGGNAGDWLDVGHGFTAFVPDVHVSSPIDDSSWEGRGVAPDIAAPAAEALAVAHREAVRRLIAAATDEAVRQALQRALEAEVR